MLPRSLVVLLLLAFVLAHAITLSTPLHVVYAVQGTTLTTFVASQSGHIKQVGSLVNLGTGLAAYPVPSSTDGRFLYVPCCAGGDQQLSVYSTDAQGVPNSQPIQTLSGNFTEIDVDPGGRFAYVLALSTDKTGNQIYAVRLYDIDSNGKLTFHDVAGRHNEGSCCQWWNLDEFNSQGTKVYEDEGSDLGGGGGSNWYEQRIDSHTGKLSKKVFRINGLTAAKATMLTPPSVTRQSCSAKRSMEIAVTHG